MMAETAESSVLIKTSYNTNGTSYKKREYCRSFIVDFNIWLSNIFQVIRDKNSHACDVGVQTGLDLDRGLHVPSGR